MPLLDKFKRRLLNLWLLEYTVADAWEWLQLRFRQPRASPEANQDVVNRHPTAHYFDRIMVISLPFRADRRECIRQQMAHLELNYTFFDAIHGQSLEVKGLNEALFAPITKRYLPKGSLGCALSHIAVWQEVVAREWPSCVIFEDDVVLPGSFVEDARQYLSEVPPDFDIVYLGSGKTATANIRKFVSPHVFEPFYPREGMYGYVVSAKGAKKLLANLFPIRLANGGVDTVVGKLVRQRKLRAYHVWPVLCRADLVSPSNVPNPGGKAKVMDERQ
jgi:glycosyl transferase, family 25